jgi:uncharacterized protein
MDIDWDILWEQLAAMSVLGAGSIHGPAHWQRVERYGVDVAAHSGGDVTVARLFAVFHDVCRQNESIDDAHGARGAALAVTLRGTLFDLPDEPFDRLHAACVGHTDARVSDDPTIGACWDADRLDLWRVGITIRPRFLSTPYARDLVLAGRVGPTHLPAEICR